MIIFVLGYFFMGLIFLVLRFLHHVLLKNSSRKNLVRDAKDNFLTYSPRINAEGSAANNRTSINILSST